MDDIRTFFRNVSARLKKICEGDFGATDEILAYEGDDAPKELNELAETVGLMSVKLEAREMALDSTIKELESAISYRRQFGLFFILYAVYITIFAFISAYVDDLNLTPERSAVVIPAICFAFLVILVVCCVVYVRLSPFSRADFGLTFKGSKKAIIESLAATVPVLILLTLIRWWGSDHIEALKGKPFFDTNLTFANFWIYFLVAPAQEFCGRGVTQGVIFRLLEGKHAAFWSVILASIIFAVTHTHLSFSIAILSALGGLFWGWLYTRHNTIVGVSISHIIIGNYMVLLGLWTAI